MDPLLRKAYVTMFGSEQWESNNKRCFAYLSQTQTPDTVTSSVLSWLPAHVTFYSQMGKVFLLMVASMIHNKGLKAAHPPPSIVASGMATLSQEAMHVFESPQRTFPLLLRHTYNQSLSHPLSKGVRSCSVELGSFFHTTFLSGECCPFFNIETFLGFTQSMHALSTGDRKQFLDYFQKYPVLWNCIPASLHPTHAPSYLLLHYYSMMTFDVNIQGTSYLVRFRVVPLEPRSQSKARQNKKQKDQEQKKEEKGKEKPVEAPQLTAALVDQFMAPGMFWTSSDEKQPLNVYELDYASKLKERGCVRYSMKYQLRVVPSTKREEGIARNASLAWNKTHFPFRTFALFEIHKILPDDNSSAFDITKLPKNVTLPDASSVDDPRIIGQTRKFVYPKLQYLRGAYRSLRDATRFLPC
jgi:hypothetical protein